ncbi:hypothetical protein ACK8OR_01385 [Jannaschia sp. KMU-145]|uniref:hypothetical protein n=1 Tax=Jannaschia halovivens TaxID=3388667 RepID=UPI00396B255A
MSEIERDYFGQHPEPPVEAAPRPAERLAVAPPAPAAPARSVDPGIPRQISRNAVYIGISLVSALIFGLYAGLFVRAFGDPEVHGIWVSIGSVLFTLWVIAVTIWAVLRLSAWASAILLRTTARVSIVAYRILKTPIRIASILAFFGLAIYGAVVLLSRLSAG